MFRVTANRRLLTARSGGALLFVAAQFAAPASISSQMEAIETKPAATPVIDTCRADPAAPPRLNTALPAILAQLKSLPENQWWLASRNAFSDSWTPAELRPLNNGKPASPSRVITAWGGFAWDSRRSELWLFGGGHGDYSGNEVYRWRAADGLWQRASLPSEIVRDGNGIDMAVDGVDAAPAASHPYANNVYLPRLDRLLSFGGAAYNNGGAWRRTIADKQWQPTGPYLFDPNRADPWLIGGSDHSHVQRSGFYPELSGGQMWQNRDSYRQHLGSDAPPNNHVNGCSTYVEEDGDDVVYVAARSGGGTALQLYRYQIVTLAQAQADHWQQVGRFWSSPSDQTTCAYDPERRWLVRTGAGNKPFLFWDLAVAGRDNREQILVPNDPGGTFFPALKAKDLRLRQCGMVHDPIRRRFLLWCGGGALWVLQQSSKDKAWQIERLLPATAAAAIPDAVVGHGVLGKWQYAPELDVFVALQDGRAGRVWFYKPPDWQPRCPDASAP